MVARKPKIDKPEVVLENDMMLYTYLPVFGYQPTSLVDYPGEVASVIFTCGCTFRCSWCHNREEMQIIKAMDIKSYESMLADIIASKSTAVVITGGEPTMWPDTLIQFCKWLRHFVPNKKIKLDTNGSNFGVVEKLIKEGLVDFIAMDIKTTLKNDMYTKHFCSKREELEVYLTAQMLLNSNIQHMFRHTEDINDTPEIIAELKSVFTDIVIQKQVIRKVE